MIRLHPYQYTHFNQIAGTVREADNRYMLDYWGLALEQASEGLREEIIERQEIPPRNRKWRPRGLGRGAPHRLLSALTSPLAGIAMPRICYEHSANSTARD